SLFDGVKRVAQVHLHTPDEQQVSVPPDDDCEWFVSPERLSEHRSTQSVGNTPNLDDSIAWHRVDVRQRHGTDDAVTPDQPDLQRLARIERADERDDGCGREVDRVWPFMGAKHYLSPLERHTFEMRLEMRE